MNARRTALRRLAGMSALGGASGLAGLAGWLGAGAPGTAQAADYRALVCVHLNGGCDGNDVLVPTDAAYGDYSRARPDIALPRSGLVSLPGSSAGHTFGVNPALGPIAPLYGSGRLAFVANVGPLIRPVTAAQVLAGTAEVPPFLLSHSDQVAIQHGWGGDEDQSGWAGRALESLPGDFAHSLAAVSIGGLQTLLTGQRSPVTRTNPGGQCCWGHANLNRPDQLATQLVARLAQLQSPNAYEAEYARTMLRAFDDAIELQSALDRAADPAGDFPAGTLGEQMRHLARLLPVFKAQGKRRQVFLVDWGSFDTHSGQRGTGDTALDGQLGQLAAALAAFDRSMQAAGLDSNVVTFTSSDFGRTLKPASGAGTDHAWGSHHMVFGGPVRGGQVHGQFPSLVLGGADDGDPEGEGRWVPTTATDQLGAAFALWLGMPDRSLHDVFPNLRNFARASLPVLG